MPDRDATETLRAQINEAFDDGTPLSPEGGGSKRFLGRTIQAQPIATGEHRGIVSYEPTELVVTARCGTPLIALEQALAERNQTLPFEPPRFGDAATIGGTIASGLSGPRRPFAGAARDFVLGMRVINGKGEALRLGGEVMKNVAGYDLSRLITGSMGTLGLILDVSLKVLPRPPCEVTLRLEHDPGSAIELMNALAARPLPLSAMAQRDRTLSLRLSGTERGVRAACERIGGETVHDGDRFWTELREHRLEFFQGEAPLWRLSVPSTAPPLALPGDTMIDWGGALRWLRTDADAGSVRSVAASVGGHAQLFSGGDRHAEVYHPLSPVLLRLHQRIKNAFDPKGIFSPGRMYPEV